jgi:hypothetical protein
VKAATPRDHVGDESAPTPRAELLRDLGRNDEARAADQSALELTAKKTTRRVIHSSRGPDAGPVDKADEDGLFDLNSLRQACGGVYRQPRLHLLQ